MGTRKIRIADLPPEVTDQAISRAFTSYGEVMDIRHGTWSSIYRYKAPNGIRTALTTIKKHIPSRMIIGGYRATISYEGQPPTCFGCNGADHQYQQCPNRKRRYIQKAQTTNTWADVQQGPHNSQTTPETHDNRDRITESITTQQDSPTPTIQERSEIMQLSHAKEVLEDSTSKGPFDGGMQDNRPVTAKADIGNAQLYWADDQEHMTPMEVATHTPDTNEAEEEAGDQRGPILKVRRK